MERHKLSSEQAELIINTLRDNPGVQMTLGDLSDETGIDADELAAYLEEFAAGTGSVIDRDTTPDGFDVYSFNDNAQRGATAPSDI